MAMDLRRLEILLAVADHGGFTAAADELGISQPAVSQAVRALERDLGAPLLHRLGRAVRLTDAGAALAGPARIALREAAVARAAVDAVRGLDQGLLELACLPTLAASPLAPLVGEFRRRHRGVRIALSDPDGTGALLELVTSGACEVGLVGPCDPGALEVVELAPQDLLAVLPPGPDAPARLDLEAFAQLPIVAPPPGSSSRDLLDGVLATRGLVADVVVETAQREALLPLVLAGAGAALVPRALAEAGRALGCAVAEVRGGVTREVRLVRRPEPQSPAALAFCELAVQLAGTTPSDEPLLPDG